METPRKRQWRPLADTNGPELVSTPDAEPVTSADAESVTIPDGESSVAKTSSTSRSHSKTGAQSKEPSKYATFWQRLLSAAIDYFLSGMILAIIGLPISAAAMVYCPADIMMGILLASGVLLIILEVLYFGAFESSSLEATPGKLLLGIRVADVHEKRLSFLSAASRQALVLVSALIGAPIVLSGVLVFSKTKQSVYDKITRRIVLRDNRQILSPLQRHCLWCLVVFSGVIISTCPFWVNPARIHLMCKLIESHAKAGDLRSQFKLAWLYQNIDMQKSQYWCEMLESKAKSGNPEAQSDLAYTYENLYKNKSKSAYWHRELEKSAAAGNKMAQRMLISQESPLGGPGPSETEFDRGIALSTDRKYAEAITCFSRVIIYKRNDRMVYFAYCERAQAYAAIGQNDKALSDLNKAVPLLPSDETALLQRAEIFKKLAQKNKAIDDYSRAISLVEKKIAEQLPVPAQVEAAIYRNRAELYKAAGKPELAKRDEAAANKLTQKPSRK